MREQGIGASASSWGFSRVEIGWMSEGRTTTLVRRDNAWQAAVGTNSRNACNLRVGGGMARHAQGEAFQCLLPRAAQPQPKFWRLAEADRSLGDANAFCAQHFRMRRVPAPLSTRTAPPVARNHQKSSATAVSGFERSARIDA